MWDLPGPGVKPVSPALAGGFLTTEPPGKPCRWFLRRGVVAQMNPPEMQETQVQSLGWGDPLEEDMATHSSVLAWKIPTDRGACWAVVHGVAESDTTGRLSTAAHGFAQRRGKKAPGRAIRGLRGGWGPRRQCSMFRRLGCLRCRHWGWRGGAWLWESRDWVVARGQKCRASCGLRVKL